MMSTWVWGRLPGPWFVKSILIAVVVVAAVYSLFEFVFPWLSAVLNLQEQTVEAS